jgi:hypothetical protein
MIIACLALFVVSAGTGIAARHYLITSTKQIKPSVLKQLKGAKGPKGATGAVGATGAAGSIGATGAAGAAGATHVVKRFVIGTADSTVSGAIASCNAGEVATGGGIDWNSATGGAIPVVSYSQPAPFSMDNAVPTGWRGAVRNLNSPTGTVTVQVWVICASP